MTLRNPSTHALALLAAALLAATTAGHACAANVAAGAPDAAAAVPDAVAAVPDAAAAVPGSVAAVPDAAAAVPGSAAASPDATAALPDSAAEASAAHEPIATAALPAPDPSASATPGALTPRTTAHALVTATVPAAHAPTPAAAVLAAHALAPAAAGTSAIRQSDPSAKADPPATSPSAPDSATTTAEVSDEFAVSAVAAHSPAANAGPADLSASTSTTSTFAQSNGAAATGSAAAPVPAAAAPVTAVPAAAPAPPATTAPPDATASSAPATATSPAAGSPASTAAAPAPPAAGSPVTPPTPPNDPETLARAYRRTGAAPTVEITDQGRGAVSLVPFGHGKPILRCAPLRACAVELEPGELILSTSLGDAERWLVQSAAAGPGARTPLLVVKPTACDLSTNLVVATDRRIYELALDSPPCHNADLGAGGGGGAAGAGGEGAYNPRLPYTGLVRFYYPDDLVRRWTDQEALAREQDAAQAAGRTPLAPAARLAHLNFDYSWDRSRRWPWVPAQVFDDGEHTYLVLPPAARLAELPILLAVEPGGALALLTYHLEDQTLVADRVLDHAVLLVGHGRPKDEQRLEIVNRAFPAAAAQATRNAQTRRPAEAGH
jgi:type IV secretory pathway VirB9-like protein